MKQLKNIFYFTLIAIFGVIHEADAQVTFYFNSPIAKTDPKVILKDFLKWVLSIAGAIALLALIMAGIMYMTSMGNPQKAKKAKIYVKWTLAGLILILLSYAILVVLEGILV